MTTITRAATVWYYGVLDSRTMRAPINLHTNEIDWNRAEPYTEPPLTTPLPEYLGLRRFYKVRFGRDKKVFHRAAKSA